MNKTGRDDRQEHGTFLVRSFLEEPAFRAMTTTAQMLYVWLRLEWRGPQANNNGSIALSVRQAAERLGVSRNTAARAFQELQAKGFLFLTKAARLGVGGLARCSEFELTEITMPHSEQRLGRRLYKEWKPGHDFPAHKVMANNPCGANRKTKPCHQNEDSNVVKMMTSARGTSSK
ncbi:hypothetical protein N5I32_15425 [Acidimangrovimonas sediminis]|uniref:HTH crp-type domain-containing protein n=2 Tax=Albidovulum sediminis TaxID=3066345 RepID=A0ABT2NPP8_9RHOB|nr:hypothetical protein [Defluviimonas sediminis]